MSSGSTQLEAPVPPGGAAKNWLASIETRLPSLERKIVERVRGEIPEFQDDRDGQIAAEVRRAVHRSLSAFAGQSIGPDLIAGDAEVFRRLGRLEAEAGRGLTALDAAFRIASDAVAQEILIWERAYAVPAPTVSHVMSVAARFIDQLARLAAQGHEQTESARTRDDASRLLGLLVRRGGASASMIGALAARVGWRVPDRCAAVHLVWGDQLPGVVDLALLTGRLFGDRTLIGVAGGRHLAITGPPPPIAELRARLAADAPGLWLFLGPTVPLGETFTSARLAREAAELRLGQTDGGGGLVVCDDFLLDLVAEANPDAITAMVRRRLGALAAQPAAKRYRLAALLSAWLEFGGLKGDAPGVLDASRQTLSYRMQRLHALLGDQLHDRGARLEIMLALRQVLPGWARDAAGGDRPTLSAAASRSRAGLT